MSQSRRRSQVSVIGANRASPELAREAEALGAGLVEAGYRVVTGGLGGVMEAVSRGARLAAGDDEGRVVGILPGLDSSEANEHVEIVLPTGMGYARNVLVVAAGDAVVAVGGRSGTLSELAMAWQFGKPLVALDLGEGWSSRLAGEAIDDKRPDRIHRATSATHAIEIIGRLLNSAD